MVALNVRCGSLFSKKVQKFFSKFQNAKTEIHIGSTTLENFELLKFIFFSPFR